MLNENRGIILFTTKEAELLIYDISKTFAMDTPVCVENFLRYLSTIKGKSTNTIEGYRSDLKLFFRFMMLYKRQVPGNTPFEEIDISRIDESFIDTIRLNDLYAFLQFTEQYRNNGTYARARKVASLKSFYKYLYSKEKTIRENTAAELESPKIEKRQPVHLSLDQSISLLNSLDRKKKNYYRDYCILTLFLNCGLRLSELCSINRSKIVGDTLTIVGKGNKERTVYLNDACLYALSEYEAIRNNIVTEPEYENVLFLSTHRQPISPRAVERMVKNCIIAAGISDGQKYTPHKLRHTAATIMYKNGVDIRRLQSILGHESISTTEIYTHIDDEALREAVKINPLSRIRMNEEN